MENIEESISGEDKMLAMFSHLSMLIGSILLPIIIWAIKKEHSKFVRFHSLQSIFFHISYAVIVAFIIIIFAVIIIITGVGISSVNEMHNASGFSAVIIIVSFAFLGAIILTAFGVIGYSIYLAVKAYHGEKTMIPILGKIIYDRVYGKG